jgi:hypothetical protein
LKALSFTQTMDRRPDPIPHDRVTANDPSSLPAGGDALAEWLNRDCHCLTVDRRRLRESLESDPALHGLYQEIGKTRPHLFSDTAVYVSAPQVQAMTAIIEAIGRVTALPGYREAVLGWAPAIARHDPGTPGVFLAYDFHLTCDGPKLIEINTNAGGGLLIAVLGRAQQACCREVETLLTGPQPGGSLPGGFVEMFRAEWRQARGDAALATIAIVDDDPRSQYLYPEFLLFQQLFSEHGIEAVIADPGTLRRRDGRLWHGDLAVDLVYNRLTDFALADPTHAALREAYLAGEIVLTPHPRAHALHADKRNLTLLSDPERLQAFGAFETDIAVLGVGVPRTELVSSQNRDALWANRRHLFFKPAMGFGSKAAYRGDKLTKRVWEEIGQGVYVAQAVAMAGERRLRVGNETRALKFDLRCFVYGGQVQLLGARLYQGQTTNFRTEGGGLAPVFCPPAA